MPPRFEPFWYDRFPKTRRAAYPRLRGESETTVAIVGGGLTGVACASVLSAARVPVVLLEAGRIGAGATAASAGLIREDFDVPFMAVAGAHGLRAARSMFQGMKRAARELAAALRRQRIECGLSPCDLLIVSSGSAPRELSRDYDARRAAGLDDRWLRGAALRRETALDADGALRVGGAVLDPYRACHGLAVAAAARGALLFERSEVTRVRATRKGVEVRTKDAVVNAACVVIATGAPLSDLRPIRRHLAARESYTVVTGRLPAAVRRQVGARAASLRDSAAPPHLVRWLPEDRVLIHGGDQPPVAARAREQALVQRTGQLMYELSLLYPAISGTPAEWSASRPYQDTSDGLPFIGTHRNFPHHFFALGGARHGAGSAWLAARLLARHVGGDPEKGDDLFGFARVLVPH